jgi:hypothetical protein
MTEASQPATTASSQPTGNQAPAVHVRIELLAMLAHHDDTISDWFVAVDARPPGRSAACSTTAQRACGLAFAEGPEASNVVRPLTLML